MVFVERQDEVYKELEEKSRQRKAACQMQRQVVYLPTVLLLTLVALQALYRKQDGL